MADNELEGQMISPENPQTEVSEAPAAEAVPPEMTTQEDWGLSGELGSVEKVDPSEAINGNGNEHKGDEPLSEWTDAVTEQQEMDAERATPKEGMDVFEDFTEPSSRKPSHTDIEMILDIPVQITAELGRTKMEIRNLLRLAHGSVIELDGLAGEPMDVLVNGCLIARGEVVVVNDRFGIRLTDIITPSERIRKLNQ